MTRREPVPPRVTQTAGRFHLANRSAGRNHATWLIRVVAISLNRSLLYPFFCLLKVPGSKKLWPCQNHELHRKYLVIRMLNLLEPRFSGTVYETVWPCLEGHRNLYATKWRLSRCNPYAFKNRPLDRRQNRQTGMSTGMSGLTCCF